MSFLDDGKGFNFSNYLDTKSILHPISQLSGP